MLWPWRGLIQSAPGKLVISIQYSVSSGQAHQSEMAGARRTIWLSLRLDGGRVRQYLTAHDNYGLK
jgi:hypothetical protein